MDNRYQRNPIFLNPQTPTGQLPPNNKQYIPEAEMPATQPVDMFPIEMSFIENILRLNKGKIATIYMSFPDSEQWRDKSFTGIIEEAGRDHIIISDPKTGVWNLLKLIYVDYVSFDEKIEYSPAFGMPPR